MTGCPDPVRLVAASAGEDVAALAHAAGCPGCRRSMREHLSLRELALDLPVPTLDRGRRDEHTAVVLARAEHVTVARPLPPAMIVEPWHRARRAVATVAIAAGALAAAAGVLTILEPTPPVADLPVISSVEPGADGASGGARAHTAVAHLTVPPPPSVVAPAVPPAGVRPHTAAITAASGARFVRRGDGAVDRIALRDGTLTIEATSIAAPVVLTGKNVRIRTGDARLAARAEAGVMQQVQVFAGSVEIQTGAGVVVVTAGETWTWDEDAAAAARVAAFRRGWDALRGGEFAIAAAELERAVDDPGVGEDATYWAAIAWGRAGEAARARAGLERFLVRFPNATRAGEAHLALARLVADPVAARTHREAASRDPDPRVRAAAEAALAGSP